jgi:hypothetical protein
MMQYIEQMSKIIMNNYIDVTHRQYTINVLVFDSYSNFELFNIVLFLHMFSHARIITRDRTLSIDDEKLHEQELLLYFFFRFFRCFLLLLLIDY